MVVYAYWEIVIVVDGCVCLLCKMPQFTVNERAWIVQEYNKSYGSGRNGGPSVVRVRRGFQRAFRKKPPTRKNMLSMVDKIGRTGCVTNQNKLNY